MARRRVKKRTHAGAKPAAPGEMQRPGDRAPKSMVIRIGAGEVGPSVSQLVKDTRSMLEPGTASRLKERKSNKLRDYTTMAGPLGISHLLLFSRSESGNTNLRMATTPRGPTLHFRVDKYSLCKDIMKSMRRPKGQSGAEYLTPPLLVMNNFMQSQAADTVKTPDSNPVPKHLESLTTTIFQSLFSPISPNTTTLKNIKRVMLLDRVPANDPNNPHAFVLQLRHYAITAVTPKSALPKALRKLEQADHLRRGDSKRLPNLGGLDDVADYLLDPTAAAGFTSASDTEADTDAEVEVLAPENRKVLTKEERQRIRDAQRVRATGANAEATSTGDAAATATPRIPRKQKTEKKAIKLQELGPRMTLRLTKVEEGLCGGKILWHEYISKSADEQRQQDKQWEVRNKVKEERRRVQKENVERKKKERGAAGGDKDEEGDEEMEDLEEDDDEWDSEGLDDEGAGDVDVDVEEENEDDEMG